MSTGTEPARQSQLDREISQLELASSQLRDLVGELESRLSSVLREEPPADQMKEACERQALVPAATSVRECVDTIQRSNNRIAAIRERLEC